MLRRFLNDQRGATAIEYAMICGLVFLAIITALYAYGDQVNGVYRKIGDAVNDPSA